MDKRLIMAVLAVLLTMASATAQFYEDWNTGYFGYAAVSYGGSSKEGLSLEAVRDRGVNNFRNGGGWVGRQIEKLTKEQFWLLEEAIEREYDYSVGDIFVIALTKLPIYKICVFVEITATDSRGHFSYSYYAYHIGAL